MCEWVMSHMRMSQVIHMSHVTPAGKRGSRVVLKLTDRSGASNAGRPFQIILKRGAWYVCVFIYV